MFISSSASAGWQVELPAEALIGAELAREEDVPRRIHRVQRGLQLTKKERMSFFPIL